MPSLVVNVLTRWLNRDDINREVQQDFKKMGRNAGNNFAAELESASPRIRRAAAKMLDANSAMATAQREAAKAARVHGDELSRLNQIQKSISDSQRGAAANAKTLGQLERGIGDARKALSKTSRDVARQEELLALARRVHVKHARELRDAELKVQEARLNGQKTNALAKDALDLRKRDVSETQALRNAVLDLSKARETDRQTAGGASLLQKEINELRSKGVEHTRELEKASRDLASAQAAVAKADEAVANQAERVNRVRRDRDLAKRALEDARNADGNRGRKTGAGRSGFGGGQAANALGGIFTSIPFVPGGKAGAVIGSGLVATLGSVADAAVTASQALWLLPAAAIAGGAAFVTLKLGLSGFDQALKDMGDPKKFAKDLAGLAPNAQQAALEIQKLVSGLDGLKMVTQNALFKNVAAQLSQLGKAFMPEIKQMTTGIAGAFNQIFQAATSQMMDPGTHANLTGLINNIVQAFQNLAPAMGPIVDAFSKIAKVGSDFLPGMATGFANLATKFANFIDAAQRSGKLHEWIQKGIDAAYTLGQVIGELAHKIFDVFGNKNPDQFKSTLEGMAGAAVGVAQVIEGISQVVNNLVHDIQPVADALGGWPNLIQDVIAIWAEWKVANVITSLMKISEILGVTLPASAEAGATGISAALSRVAIPVWLMTLMALWNMGGDSAQVPGGNFGGQPTAPGALAPGSTRTMQQETEARKDADRAYSKDHGGQVPDGTSKWIEGKGPMPPGMGKYYVPGAAPGTPFFDKDGRPLDANGKPFGSGGNPNPTPFNPNDPKSQAPVFKPFDGKMPWDDIPVPGVPGKDKKGKLPKAVSPLDPSFGAPPRPGETEGEYSAEGTLMQARHRKADDEATLQALEKDNNASAEQIQAQKNKIIQDQREINKAELELQNAQESANKKQLKGLKSITDGMKDIGPQLDEDFGLSKGLPGLAKNLVEFIGSLAAAPLLGPLAAISAADPIKGGFGAIGIMGEANIRAGKSPLLGIPAGQPGGPSPTSLGDFSGVLPGFTGRGNSHLGRENMDPPGAFESPGRNGPGGGVNRGGVHPVGFGGTYTGQDGELVNALRAQGFTDSQITGLVALNKVETGNWSHPESIMGFTNQQTGPGLGPHVQGFKGMWDRRQQSGAVAGVGQPDSGMDAQGNVIDPAKFASWLLKLEGYSATTDWAGNKYAPGQFMSDQDYAGKITSAYAGGASPAGFSGGSGGGLLDMFTNAGFGPGGGAMSALAPIVGPGGPGTSPNGFPLNAPEAGFSVGGKSFQAAQGAAGQRLAAFAQWFNDNIEPIKEFAGYDAGGHGLGNQSNHTSGTALDINWSDFTALQGHGADARTHFGPDKMASISQALTQLGMTWGQYWMPNSRDPGHFELAGAPYSRRGPQNVGIGPSDSMPGVQPAGYSTGTGYGGAGPVGGGPFPGPPPSPGPAGGMPGFPNPPGPGSAPGPGGGTPGFPMPGGAEDNPTPQGSPKGGGWQPSGGGGLGIGGAPAAAITSAAGMFPGGGAAAQLAMKLANRTIQQAGEYAAIGVQGLQETFGVHDPDGGGNGLDDIGNNIFGRVVKGLAKAKPATPTSAGKTELPKNQQQQQGQPGQQGGDQYHGGMHIGGNLNITQAPGQNPQTTANDLAWMGSAAASTGMSVPV